MNIATVYSDSIVSVDLENASEGRSQYTVILLVNIVNTIN